MDCCLSYAKPSVLQSLPSTVKNTLNFSSPSLHRPPKPSFSSAVNSYGNRPFRRPIITGDRRRASIALASAEASRCEFSSLNTPLEPKSPAGKFLSGVLQNDRDYFPIAVDKELVQMAYDRDEAFNRVDLSFGSSEAYLHRRIAELKDHEYQTTVEDVIYMLILYNFSEIRVHLVPPLSRCIYNGRLEICPSGDYELESIHSLEVLEMIREHLTTVVGWKRNSNVKDNWATTEIHRVHLCRVYAASILYGYFLKSASLRHHLELSLAPVNRTHLPFSKSWPCGLKNTDFDRFSTVRSTSVGQESFNRGKTREKLRGYVMGFDPETLQMCAKPKSKEVVNLIEKHSCALFGDEKTGLLENDELILTSISSLKRLVLEAIAFGSFLWDIEEYVDSVYKLKENQ